MADYRFRETEDGMSVLEKKVEGQPATWVEDMKSPTPFDWIASKDYVDDKVKEANPDFKGTFDDMADIEALEDVNANDWAYLVTQDENHNDVYNRYRYTIPDGETEYEWIFEVAIKRDNFTDDEWAAITSGITSDKVQKMIIALEVSDITALTAAQIDSLKEGYVVNKVTGNSKHSYVVAYKNDTDGEMSLVYCDHETLEEVYYERVQGSWTWIQTDTTNPVTLQRVEQSINTALEPYITRQAADDRYIPTYDETTHSTTFPQAEFYTPEPEPDENVGGE